MVRHITHAGLSDIGRIRHENQDRWFADPVAGLYLVADGMGGTAEGALAAQIVVDVLPRLLQRHLNRGADIDNPAAGEQVLSAIAELSDRLNSEARKCQKTPGAGSTVVLAVVRDNRALIAHLGGSRAYRFHDETVEQLTHDHSLVQALVDSGDITMEQAKYHPVRGRLTRYVGMPGEALPEARLLELANGDRLLLCSDGLSQYLTSEELNGVVETYRAPREACQRLVSAAIDGGGSDNVTAIAIAISACEGSF